jgi:hypothetical protein
MCSGSDARASVTVILLPRGMLLLPASAAASYPLLLPARTGGQGGARIHAAKLQALNGRLLRSSFSTLSCSCSPSPSPGDGGEDSARSLFDVIPFMADETSLPILTNKPRFQLACTVFAFKICDAT